MSRFFLTPEDSIETNKIVLRGENHHHLSRVLRARVGEAVEVCDGKGTDYFCRCASFEKECARLSIEQVAQSAAENGPKVTLYQCIAKGEKMEQIITRTVEMGVYRIVPVLSRFCVARPEQAEKKLERWRKIALSAAKQSGRGLVPEIAPIMDIKDAIEEMATAPKAFVCFEKEEKQTLAELEMGQEVSFLIGSEGGLSDEECAMWEQKGIGAVTLGSRILRTENAAAYVLPVLFYKLQTEVRS